MKFHELHAHIEGSVTTKTLIRLIVKYKEPSTSNLPDYFSDYQKETIKTLYTMIESCISELDLEQYLFKRLVLNSPVKKLVDFLKRIPSKYLKYYIRSRSDLRFVIETTLDQFDGRFDRVELIFIPKSLENDWLSDDDIVETFSQVWQEYPQRKKIGFVLSLRRTGCDVSTEYATKVVSEYSKYFDKGISKLDICADEDAISLVDLKETLDILVKAKQQLTMHIGESTKRDFDFILDNYPMVKQFNHGVQAAFDKKILFKIKRNDVLLTICPLSNIFTGVLKEKQVLMALRIFKDNDIRYTIGSDDSTIINGDVCAPYKYLLEKAPELIP